jgi:hypothetical protein
MNYRFVALVVLISKDSLLLGFFQQQWNASLIDPVRAD